MSFIPDRIFDGAHRSPAAVGLDRDLPPIRRNVDGSIDYDHYLRQARILRAHVIGSALRKIGGVVSGWIRAWRAQHAHRRAVAELWALDDRILRDLGLDRSSLHYVVDHGREDVPAAANLNAPAAARPRAA